MRVQNILAHKGPVVVTVEPHASLTEVIASLSKHGIGALIVSADNRTIAGIVTERDIVRALASHGPDLLGMPVRDIMTMNVLTCAPEEEVRSVARTMTDKRFRHMPVTIDGAIAGIVSIGDVVKSRLDELETEHDQLLSYISSTG
jgi:CBS domain-containing protein